MEMADHLIAPLDLDMAADVHNYLRAKGIHLLLNTAVTGAEPGFVCTAEGKIPADLVVLSIGVRPESALARGLRPGLQRARRHPGGRRTCARRTRTSTPWATRWR